MGSACLGRTAPAWPASAGSGISPELAVVPDASAQWAHPAGMASSVLHPDSLPGRAFLLLALPRPGTHCVSFDFCRLRIRAGGSGRLNWLAADVERGHLDSAGPAFLFAFRSRRTYAFERRIRRDTPRHLLPERPSPDSHIHRPYDGRAVAVRIPAPPSGGATASGRVCAFRRTGERLSSADGLRVRCGIHPLGRLSEPGLLGAVRALQCPPAILAISARSPRVGASGRGPKYVYRYRRVDSGVARIHSGVRLRHGPAAGRHLRRGPAVCDGRLFRFPEPLTCWSRWSRKPALRLWRS